MKILFFTVSHSQTFETYCHEKAPIYSCFRCFSVVCWDAICQVYYKCGWNERVARRIFFCFWNVHRINYIGQLKGEGKIEDRPTATLAWLLHLKVKPGPVRPEGEGHKQWFLTLVTRFFFWGGCTRGRCLTLLPTIEIESLRMGLWKNFLIEWSAWSLGYVSVRDLSSGFRIVVWRVAVAGWPSSRKNFSFHCNHSRSTRVLFGYSQGICSGILEISEIWRQGLFWLRSVCTFLV